jgi:hypothetical protein
LAVALQSPPPASKYRYPLRPDVPRRFVSQDIPDAVDVDVDLVAHHFLISDGELMRAINASQALKVSKQTIEIFTQMVQTEFAFTPPSHEQTQRVAQSILLRIGHFSAKELRRSLMARLQVVLSEKGFPDSADWKKLGQILDMLIVARPGVLQDAQRKALATAMTTVNAAELPEALETDDPLTASRLNVYGRFPAGMNSWETRFGVHLDDDSTDTVLWWHRNVPHKSWSINVLRDDGRGFFPDFIVGIRDRARQDNGLLADTKYAWETSAEFPKLLAEHAMYGKAVILTIQQDKPGWQVVGLDKSGRPHIERPFRIAEASMY